MASSQSKSHNPTLLFTVQNQINLKSFKGSFSPLLMGKKKNVSAPAAAGSSQSKTIDELKTLNNQLVEEVSELRKQIQLLRVQMDSLAADHRILASTLSDHVAHSNAEMDVLMKKEDSTAAKVDAVERKLLAVLREEDEIRREIERIREEMNSSLRYLEKEKKVADRGGRKWNKWIYPFVAAAVVTASVGIAKAVMAFKDSNIKN